MLIVLDLQNLKPQLVPSLLESLAVFVKSLRISGQDVQFIFGSEYSAQEDCDVEGQMYYEFYQVERILKQQIKFTEFKLSQAICRAMCFVQKKSQPRVLVVSTSVDETDQYIPLMNAFFTAQRLKVPVDVLRVVDDESVFMQQGAHITGGCYVHTQEVLQPLMSCFWLSKASRETFQVPQADEVDLRATCFCHGTIVDIAFVCSVCLSVYCKKSKSCSTCGTIYHVVQSSS